VKQLLKEFSSGGNHPNYGKKRSVETVNKIIASSAHLSKPVYYSK
jgi:NUMOD3 motif